MSIKIKIPNNNNKTNIKYEIDTKEDHVGSIHSTNETEKQKN